mmetsp:Transcript_94425/g.305497  ORF Transcript_94425/g.305497 Transcript_94425/m.305497 type:complete len:247 (-) Transcript_94425:977-1717(-)
MQSPSAALTLSSTSPLGVKWARMCWLQALRTPTSVPSGLASVAQVLRSEWAFAQLASVSMESGEHGRFIYWTPRGLVCWAAWLAVRRHPRPRHFRRRCRRSCCRCCCHSPRKWHRRRTRAQHLKTLLWLCRRARRPMGVRRPSAVLGYRSWSAARSLRAAWSRSSVNGWPYAHRRSSTPPWLHSRPPCASVSAPAAARFSVLSCSERPQRLRCPMASAGQRAAQVWCTSTCSFRCRRDCAVSRSAA